MFVRIDASSGIPITRQMADQIRAQCASGTLGPGDRLPSVRVLARELAVNQNTILRVYERLTMEGLLERRHGDGTYVADQLPPGQLKTQKNLLEQDIKRVVQRAATLGVVADDVHNLIDRAFNHIRQVSRAKGGSHE